MWVSRDLRRREGFEVGFSEQNNCLQGSLSVFVVIMKQRCFSLSSIERANQKHMNVFLTLSILAC